MSPQLLLSGYIYHPKYGPCWQVDTWDTPAQRLLLPVHNQVVELVKADRAYCTGTYDAAHNQYIPCPHRSTVKSPYKNCYPCFQGIGFNPAFYHVEKHLLSARQQAINKQPHATYLAYFGPGITKVGITRGTRVQTRWLEQGARAAVVIQLAQDAYGARALEERVSALLRIPERITSVQKKRLLTTIPYSYPQAKEKLSQQQRIIHDTLGILHGEAAIQNLQNHYLPQGFPTRMLDADRHQQPIAGCVLGMVGDLLVYKAANRLWVAGLKNKLGSTFVKASLSKLICR